MRAWQIDVRYDAGMSGLRISRKGDCLLVEVHVVPRASRSKLLGVHDGRLKISLEAPPVDGEANQALLAFLAKLLDLPRRDVTLCRGESSRQKLVSLRGVTENVLQGLLEPPP
jgi:uncharacterized protein (TIGR00251 family)